MTWKTCLLHVKRDMGIGRQILHFFQCLFHVCVYSIEHQTSRINILINCVVCVVYPIFVRVQFFFFFGKNVGFLIKVTRMIWFASSIQMLGLSSSALTPRDSRCGFIISSTSWYITLLFDLFKPTLATLAATFGLKKTLLHSTYRVENREGIRRMGIFRQNPL